MSENVENEPKFTVEQLVLIGDAIHDSKTAIIIADNENNGSHSVTVCVRGIKHKLKEMLYEVFKSNADFENICSDALVSYKMDKIQQGLDKLNNSNQ